LSSAVGLGAEIPVAEEPYVTDSVLKTAEPKRTSVGARFMLDNNFAGTKPVQLGRSERAFLYFWVANRAAKSAS
jgi:hypothetical protein